MRRPGEGVVERRPAPTRDPRLRLLAASGPLGLALLGLTFSERVRAWVNQGGARQAAGAALMLVVACSAVVSLRAAYLEVDQRPNDAYRVRWSRRLNLWGFAAAWCFLLAAPQPMGAIQPESHATDEPPDHWLVQLSGRWLSLAGLIGTVGVALSFAPGVYRALVATAAREGAFLLCILAMLGGLSIPPVLAWLSIARIADAETRARWTFRLYLLGPFAAWGYWLSGGRRGRR